jgi:hypothetical protein
MLKAEDENSYKGKTYFMYEWKKISAANKLDRYEYRYEQSNGGAEIIDGGHGEVLLYETSDSGRNFHGKYATVEEAQKEADSWT